MKRFLMCVLAMVMNVDGFVTSPFKSVSDKEYEAFSKIHGTNAADLYYGAKDRESAATLSAKSPIAVPDINQFQSPYAASLQKSTAEYALGKPQEFKLNTAFNITQPEIEKQAEAKLSSKLAQGETDMSAANQKAYQARTALLQESFNKQRAAEAERYNRLGLASSTPGLQAQGEIDRTQRLTEQDLAAQIELEDYNRRLEAERIAQTYIDKALGLGQTQVGRQQYTQQQSMADMQRQATEQEQRIGAGQRFLQEQTFNPADYYAAELQRKNQNTNLTFKS